MVSDSLVIALLSVLLSYTSCLPRIYFAPTLAFRLPYLLDQEHRSRLIAFEIDMLLVLSNIDTFCFRHCVLACALPLALCGVTGSPHLLPRRHAPVLFYLWVSLCRS
jgi:hypothetical protein